MKTLKLTKEEIGIIKEIVPIFGKVIGNYENPVYSGFSHSPVEKNRMWDFLFFIDCPHSIEVNGENFHHSELTFSCRGESYESFTIQWDSRDWGFFELLDSKKNPTQKRVRQIRDALNKCKNPDLIEQVGKILNV